MKKIKIKEDVAVNNTHILESGDEVIIFTPEEYQKSIKENKINEKKVK